MLLLLLLLVLFYYYYCCYIIIIVVVIITITGSIVVVVVVVIVVVVIITGGIGLDGISKVKVHVPQAQVTEGLSSSVFEVTALATIPSDSSAHKVIIILYIHVCTYNNTIVTISITLY